jgi:uncharacterized protein YbbK (DUF523 family)
MDQNETTLFHLFGDEDKGIEYFREIRGCSGEAVFNEKCGVLNREGEDIAQEFATGASETFRIAKLFHIIEFMGESKSPSCDCAHTQDGTFALVLIDGDGVTAALPNRKGIPVMTGEES